eukprot:TRINITY_DN61425_c0_g1_i1.p1 TRINITY_DN61425_c0_g1~~TRINITY_DN61425_c0_g1_i1.p1  ORF type:complete len:191 (-),score=41.28 TRINITY_DN61425_c0_g1_i1:24-596(-)
MASVVVASTAAMKVGAVRQLFGEGLVAAGGSVEGVTAASGIGEQPFGHEETIRGAMNRLADAQRLRPRADFYVAIENGIFEVATPEKRYFDLAWVVVAKGDGGDGKPCKTALAHSVGIEMPKAQVEEAREEGFDRTHAGHKIAAAHPGVNKQDPHMWITADRCCRQDLLVGALTAAWGQLQQQQQNAAVM